MDSGKVANWLQVIGNIGIILGLVFVGFQLYQDRQLKLAEMSAGYFEGRILANSAAMGDNPQKSIVRAATNPSEMTAEDAYVFLLNLDNWRTLDLRSSRLEQIGLYSDFWQSYSGLILEAKTEMGLREMDRWLSQGSTNFPPEYIEKLRREIDEPGQRLEFKERLEILLGNSQPTTQ